MPNCTAAQIEFPAFKRRKIQADFSGGAITSDAGVLLLRSIDRQLNLTERVAAQMPDPRDPTKIRHSLVDLLRQRVYGLACGYEDLNDHDTLRNDIAFQTAVEKDQALGSRATLCRFEQQADRALMWRVHEELLAQFIASYDTPPPSLILDFDATDDPVYGQQEGRFFHGYYRHYCFLPLYVFCGNQCLVSYLRPSNIDGAKHSWAILALLVKRLRQAWPEVEITFRGDSGFCRHPMLNWCEHHNVHYIVGLAKNSRLKRLSQPWIEQARVQYETQQCTQRVFTDFCYQAGTWKRKRRVLHKAEHMAQGSNPRYVVTDLKGDPQTLYEQVYCARGEMENRIKEQQLDLFADRTSCSLWWPNQFRLLLSTLAYTLVAALRRIALHNTELAHATCATIRLKLFKIGAVVIRNTRRVRLLLSSHYPFQVVFRSVCQRLCPT
ncbi:MAG: IS1380 family transposase [Methylosarcina sp.]